MGRSRYPRPARLAVKLREVRMRLGLTQAEMFERLGDTGTRLYPRHIDDYEEDWRVPPLQVVLAYARAAGIPMEAIVDDALDLPGWTSPMPKTKSNKKRPNKSPR